MQVFEFYLVAHLWLLLVRCHFVVVYYNSNGSGHFALFSPIFSSHFINQTLILNVAEILKDYAPLNVLSKYLI